MSINPWSVVATIGLLVLAIVLALAGLTELALFAMVGAFLALAQTMDAMSSSKPKRRRDRWPGGGGDGGAAGCSGGGSGCSGGSSGCSGGSSGGCGGGGGGGCGGG